MKRRLKSFLLRVFYTLPPAVQCRVFSLRSSGKPALGAGCFIHRSVQILGKSQVAIGANSVISQDSWLNVNHRERPGHAISIGNHCFIGRRNVFSSGANITFGDYVLTANDCHFLGSTHLVSDPMRPVITTGTSATAVITVGTNTFIGAGARILGHVQVGHGCVIGAGALVTRNVPPFSQAHGSPSVIVKRYSFPRQCWVRAEEFSVEDEAALPDSEDYRKRLAEHGPIRMPHLAAGNDMGSL
jgi:acetyltransferase-like isoleucine patch superfamily enzyme